ncbi:MAG TPA: hypothetical protein VN578_17370 [Candidatus Binatia bacterium]|nr:hypothetical protein [Candidatus Binatia bacterium]
MNLASITSLLAVALSLESPAAQPPAGSHPATSQWVYYDANRKLAYKTLNAGDRIMDFSSAGYLGGGIALPSVPVAATVSPSGGDDTATIQKAIDAVSRMEPSQGFRGAILLKPGVYRCASPLTLNTDGVVLRGSGSGPNGTALQMTGNLHVCVSISGPSRKTALGKPVQITDSYVPSGTTSFHVENASDFKAGDMLLVSRPITSSWVKFMHMPGARQRHRFHESRGNGLRAWLDYRLGRRVELCGPKLCHSRAARSR